LLQDTQDTLFLTCLVDLPLQTACGTIVHHKSKEKQLHVFDRELSLLNLMCSIWKAWTENKKKMNKPQQQTRPNHSKTSQLQEGELDFQQSRMLCLNSFEPMPAVSCAAQWCKRWKKNWKICV